MQPIVPIPDLKNEKAFKLIDRAINMQQGSIILLGITGAGGAGKTTFAENLVQYYGKEQSLTIDLDDYLLSREK